MTMSKQIFTAELHVLIKTLFAFNKFNENARSAQSAFVNTSQDHITHRYKFINTKQLPLRASISLN